VVTIQQNGTATPLYTGVYALDPSPSSGQALGTGRTRQLTDYVKPVALLDAGAAIIVGGCQVGVEAYVMALE
jgi:hypothetical protein